MAESMVQGGRGLVAWMAEEWAHQFVEAFQSRTREAAGFEPGSARVESVAVIRINGEDYRGWEQPLHLGPGARIWVGLPAASVRDLGKRILRAAGEKHPSDESGEAAFLEFLGMSLEQTATQIHERLHIQESPAFGAERLEIPEAEAGFLGRLSVGDSDTKFLFVGPATRQEEAAWDSFGSQNPGATAANLQSLANACASPQANEPHEATPNEGTMDLLLDVELPVKISFGKALLPLKEVLKLTSGSLVELNRAPEDLVEVIVNNAVIAYGEVVAVDGNYGVRIRKLAGVPKLLDMRLVAEQGVRT
ncbi:MAG: FliM/FliN family flagellar motor switch protein [Acidobacteria bacterium]|nr:FliM/FliN family flagellar motor switch protein [Acidobacteriota bacterium]